MRRNYGSNSRLNRRNNNGNQTTDTAENVIQTVDIAENGMDTEINIPPNIDAEQSIEQGKENIQKNIEEDNATEDNTVEGNLAEDNAVKDNSTKDNTVEDSTEEDSTKEDSTKEDSTEEDSTEEDSTEDNIDSINKIIETGLDMAERVKKTTMEEDLDMPFNEIKKRKEYFVKNEIQEESLPDIDRNTIIINKERYEILASEHLYIFHPEYFGISPTWANDSNFQYKCLFELKDHQLYLKSFQVTSDRGYPVINDVKPEIVSSNQELETVQYINVNEPIEYSGAIMFANSLVKDYRIQYHLDMNNPLCFSYKFVGELIFEEGRLITSVNHNKAMRRIRRNIDLGLRSLDKKQDVKCIIKFIKVSFIGDYQPQEKKKKRNGKEKLKNKNIRNKDMRNKDIRNKDVHMMESGKKKYMDKIRQHIKMRRLK